MLQSHLRLLIVMTAVSVSLCGGCYSPYIRWPSWNSPGPAAYQRAEAVAHDPYPLDDVGPEVVGGRPLGYQKPVPEVTRARMASPRRATAPLAIPFTNTQIMPSPPPVYSQPPPVYSQTMPGAPPPVVNAPPNAPPIGYDPYATSPPTAVPYSPPQPVPAPFSTPQPVSPGPYAVPPPMSSPYTVPASPAPYAVGPPAPAPYSPAPYSSSPYSTAPPAPYRYTPATPLEAFPSRVPY